MKHRGPSLPTSTGLVIVSILLTATPSHACGADERLTRYIPYDRNDGSFIVLVELDPCNNFSGSFGSDGSFEGALIIEGTGVGDALDELTDVFPEIPGVDMTGIEEGEGPLDPDVESPDSIVPDSSSHGSDEPSFERGIQIGDQPPIDPATEAMTPEVTTIDPRSSETTIAEPTLPVQAEDVVPAATTEVSNLPTNSRMDDPALSFSPDEVTSGEAETDVATQPISEGLHDAVVDYPANWPAFPTLQRVNPATGQVEPMPVRVEDHVAFYQNVLDNTAVPGKASWLWVSAVSGVWNPFASDSQPEPIVFNLDGDFTDAHNLTYAATGFVAIRGDLDRSIIGRIVPDIVVEGIVRAGSAAYQLRRGSEGERTWYGEDVKDVQFLDIGIQEGKRLYYGRERD